MEIGSMVGNFSRIEEPHVHIHVTVSGPECSRSPAT
jgi:predicted DNA-binding protein with PD1-like motif